MEGNAPPWCMAMSPLHSFNITKALDVTGIFDKTKKAHQNTPKHKEYFCTLPPPTTTNSISTIHQLQCSPKFKARIIEEQIFRRF